ncbi:MAG: hypothetical protein ACOY4L_04950 [Pseudomonadota bacterium]
MIRGVLASRPETLPAYFALYKLYFRQSRLGEAEAAARLALDEAARQGGFPSDWHALESRTASWTAVDSPAHFYLFSLKALAFILLRQGQGAESSRILDKLAELDPSDCVGASVIRAYAAGAAIGEPRPAWPSKRFPGQNGP